MFNNSCSDYCAYYYWLSDTKNNSLPQITSENLKVKDLEASLAQNRIVWCWGFNPKSRCGRDNKVVQRSNKGNNAR